MGQIDLHVHSVCSDGTFTPKQLVDRAMEKGLSAIALTDHDTVDGITEMLEYAKNKPIEIIPGIEYSTEYNGRDVHIVGLFIDYTSQVFKDYLSRFQASRDNRNKKLCDNLRRAGIDITCEELSNAFPNATITRAHYARLMLDKGYVKSTGEAFDRYLGDHTPYFVHREKITPEEVISVTRKAGGIPILAHPMLYGLGNEQLDLLVSRLKEAGLMGIEAIYSTYTPQDERKVRRLAKKYNLLISGGSDFHGENKKGLELGIGYGHLYVNDDILKKLKQTLEKKILFTDLDGTLLNDDKTISESLRSDIIDMIKRGASFVLASGRPLESILEVLETLNIKEEVRRLQQADELHCGGIYATAYNGAMLYDCMNEKVMAEYCIRLETAQRLFEMAKEQGIHIHTYSDDTHIISCADDKELEYYMRYVHLPYIVVEGLTGTLSHAPYKLVAIDLDGRERLEMLREKIEASELGEEVTCAFSNDNYLEFYHKAAGKGNALVKLCRQLNILEGNAAAAGDEENDISMLEAAGLGAAMANANPRLKEYARYVTENDNNHDGIHEVIALLCGHES